MEVWVRLLAVLFMLLTGANEQAATPPTPPNAVHSQTVIETVQAQILRSHPAQIVLVIDGYQPDGCDYPVQVAQSRDGNTVTLDIYREMPQDIMCPMIVRSYHQSIHLDGTFPSGTYTIHVNDYTLEVTV